MIAAIAAGTAFLLTVIATRAVLAHLIRLQILDAPNARSSHRVPTPRGGGLGVVPVVVLAWLGLAVAGAPGTGTWALTPVAGAVVLMAVSWLDDRRGLPPLWRLVVQALVVAVATAALPHAALVFGGWLPWWADRAVAGLGWLWFVNLTNFMDGIDGITGVETMTVATGIAVVAALAGHAGQLTPFAAALAGAAAGFLVWNWHPARVFLGDVGSVPLGFLLGGLLLRLAVAGQLAAALILPAYYLADATLTLVRRAVAGEKVWQAHRHHFYQRAVQGGKRHDQVARAILAANLLLGIAAVVSLAHPAAAAAAAMVVVALLLALLQRWSAP